LKTVIKNVPLETIKSFNNCLHNLSEQAEGSLFQNITIKVSLFGENY